MRPTHSIPWSVCTFTCSCWGQLHRGPQHCAFNVEIYITLHVMFPGTGKKPHTNRENIQTQQPFHTWCNGPETVRNRPILQYCSWVWHSMTARITERLQRDAKWLKTDWNQNRRWCKNKYEEKQTVKRLLLGPGSFCCAVLTIIKNLCRRESINPWWHRRRFHFWGAGMITVSLWYKS